MKTTVIVHIILPLLLGYGIYLYARPHTTVLTYSFDQHFNLPLPAWVKYNLPDGLWLWSLLQAISLVWGKYLLSKGLLWLIGCIALSFISEIAQLYKLIPGTYDIGDILAYAMTTALFFIFHFLNQKIHTK